MWKKLKLIILNSNVFVKYMDGGNSWECLTRCKNWYPNSQNSVLSPLVELVFDQSDKLNQTAAMAHCELLGGSLPIINNQQQAKMFQEKSKSKHVNSPISWDVFAVK